MTSVLVTGATGYIGRNLVAALQRKGDEVTVIVREGAAASAIEALGSEVTVLEDVGSESEMRSRVGECNVTDVVHLAAMFRPKHTPEDIRPMIESNITFGTRVADAVSRVSSGARFLSVGTIWQHHDNGPFNPVSLYAATKQAFEDMLVYYGAIDALDVRTLVLPDTYGPNDPRKRITSLLIEALASGEPLNATSGRGVLDLVHVADVVTGLIRALEPELGPGRWSLSSEEGVGVRNIAERLGVIAGTPVPVRWGARADRTREVTALIDAAPVLPGWRQNIQLEDGLRELLIEAEILQHSI